MRAWLDGKVLVLKTLRWIHHAASFVTAARQRTDLLSSSVKGRRCVNLHLYTRQIAGFDLTRDSSCSAQAAYNSPMHWHWMTDCMHDGFVSLHTSWTHLAVSTSMKSLSQTGNVHPAPWSTAMPKTFGNCTWYLTLLLSSVNDYLVLAVNPTLDSPCIETLGCFLGNSFVHLVQCSVCRATF